MHAPALESETGPHNEVPDGAPTASHLQRIPTGPGSSRFVSPVWGFAELAPRSIPARPDKFSGIRDQNVISRA
jgi:hypothetical protein